MKDIFCSRGNTRWYLIAGLASAAAFIFNRLFGAGFLVGIVLALGNGFLFSRYYRFFFEGKRLFPALLASGLRYAVIGVILYIAVKNNRIFFYGIISGFALSQAVFFLTQLLFLYRSPRPGQPAK